MEPDVGLDSATVIRVVILQVGEISASAFRTFSTVVTRHRLLPLNLVRKFYKELQKSPFTNEPWDSGSLKFKFILGGASRSPWEDFQAQRRIHGVIGVCHGPRCPDLNAAYEEFASASKGYPGAQARRCLVFDPSQAQIDLQATRIPNPEQVFLDPGATFTFTKPEGEEEKEAFDPTIFNSPDALMAAVMQDFAAAILMSLENWVLHADPVGKIMTTPLDPPPAANEDPAKAKKKRLARLQKAMGDFCLLAASPMDAQSHYQAAIDIMKAGNDFLWLAGALEGNMTATVAQSILAPSPEVEKEVMTKYQEIIQLYRKANATIFELEAVVKVARFICRRQMAKEVCDLLSLAVETGRGLQNPSDRLVLFIEVGRIFAQLGYERKAAFFAREVAQMYEQQESRFAAISALQVLSLTAPTYKVQSSAVEGPPPQEPDHKDKDAKANKRSRGRDSFKMVDELARTGNWNQGQWSTLQMEVLNDMLSVAIKAGDALAAWSAAARMIRGFHPLLPVESQMATAVALYSAGQRLAPGTRCADPCLPFVRFERFSSGASDTQIMKRGTGGWAVSPRAVSGPFIYTPFSRSPTTDNKGAQWVTNELVQVVVLLANPTAIELEISSLFLSIEGVPFEPFPVSIILPPNEEPRQVTLSGIPRAPGKAVARGCFVTCFGVTTENLFRTVPGPHLATKGSVPDADPFAGTPEPDPEVLAVSVLPELPLLVPTLPDAGSAPLLYEGETRSIDIQLTNNSTVPVCEAMVSISKKPKEQELKVVQESLLQALPLAPGASVSVTLTLVARCPVDPKQEDQGLEMMVQYAGPISQELSNSDGDNLLPPGRRLVVPINVNVLKGIHVARAQFLVTGGHVNGVSPAVPLTRRGPNSVAEAPSSEVMATQAEEGILQVAIRPENSLKFFDLELWNETDVGFTVSVALLPPSAATHALQAAQKEKSLMGRAVRSAPDLKNYEEAGSSSRDSESAEGNEMELCRTEVGVGCASHLLIPLAQFNLHKEAEAALALLHDEVEGDAAVRRQLALRGLGPSLSPFDVLLTSICSRLRVAWTSERDAVGELPIRDAVKQAIEGPSISALLKDPVAFKFSLQTVSLDRKSEDLAAGGTATDDIEGNTVTKHMTKVTLTVCNTSEEVLAVSLSLTCVDMAGESCIGDWTSSPQTASVLWEGTLSCIETVLEPGEDFKHKFSLCFLIPGDYVLMAAAVVDILELAGHEKGKHKQRTVCCTSLPYLVSVAASEND